MKNYDVVALGELLIDFTGNGESSQGNPMFEANPGGAPCNVLAMLTGLGHKTGFIGKVGQDMFGAQLEAALKEVGISTKGLVKDPSVGTTLAFVHTLPGGDRDFSFYRKPGADMMLRADELNADMIRHSKVFHYGTLSLTDEPCREATKKAIEIAKEAGCLLTYDPNLREPLWPSLDAAREQIDWGMRQCNVMKISDNEIEWFTGLLDYDAAATHLLQEYPNLELVLVSLGKHGSFAFTRENSSYVRAYLQDGTIETTGAGDTFCGSVIHYLLTHAMEQKNGRYGLRSLSEPELKEMLNFANAAASIVTTRKGALRVMPSLAEVKEMLG